MQEFLSETAHNKTILDPEFDVAGISYVFRLLLMGTMPWANRVHLPRPRLPSFSPSASCCCGGCCCHGIRILSIHTANT